MKNHYLKVIIGSILLILVTGSFNYKNEISQNFIKNANSEMKNPQQLEPVSEAEVIPEIVEKELNERRKYFSSSKTEGQIGISDEKPIDNPIDNIFHVNINKELTGNETIWLEYELKGVLDFTGISRSINDQLAIGGYVVKQSKEWIKQKELLNPKDIKHGDNVVRFTIPENADYSYEIRNLGIRIEPYSEVQAVSNRRLVVNQPSTEYYYGKLGYLQGFVIGNDNDKAKLLVNGETLRYTNGNFESLVEKPLNSGDVWSVRVQAVFPDGQELYVDIPFNKPSEWDYKNGFDKEIHYAEQLTSSSEAFSLQLANAKLEGNAGSLDKDTKLSITALRDIDVPALDAGMVNVTAGYKGYRFLPHGTQFQKGIAIELGYDTTKIPNGYGENDIRTYYFNEESHHWVAIPRDSVLLASNITQSWTNHFSDYINAIIKVPESPETQGYTPTSMKDVKAANPATGINLINPPQANSMGNANLSYPINIPAGRQGMQPQLAISYNSGGGNGWLGLGWDLSVPSISVETRWGVPHYHPDDESETYLMAGEQLSPVAHRHVWEERDKSSDAEKQFYPRIEGSFSIIKRHGGSPSTYWWEVTDKGGTKYYYGASSTSGGVINNAVLKDADGNIAHWALVEVRDLYDNFVKYDYTVQSDKGVTNDPNALDGYQIYLDKVTYTGHGSENGAYSVHFERDRELSNFTKRKDVTINARYGFKQVTADRLKKVDVKFQTGLIRSYELYYSDGAFNKTLLDSIVEKDSEGKRFTAHGFEYFDEVRDGADYNPYEASFKEWNTQDDDVKGDFISSSLGILDDNASAISGTKTTSTGIGLAAHVGTGVKVWSKNMTVGGNYSYSKSDSEGQLSLIDINGDGLVDKLISDGEIMKFRPQIKTKNSTTPEYATEPNDIIFDEGSSTGSFLKSTSKSHSVGLEVLFGVTIGANYGFGKSITSTYLTDANGDGLIDIVSDGVVFFNYVDDNGDVHFTKYSSNTPNLIQSGSLASGLVKVDSSELIKARVDNPLHDVVKMWKAPHGGTVRINAPVHLVEDTSAARESYPADGVIVSVQHKENEPLWNETIGANDYTEKDPGIIEITVNKYDNIYFRVQSIDDGAYDQVEWTPEIFYLDKDTSITDANGKHVFKYKSDEDYVLTAPNGFMAIPIDGVINMKSHLYIPPTSDNVTIEILHEKEVIKNIDVNWKEGYNDSIYFNNREVKKDDIFSFKVISSSNIRWEDIVWRPFVYYTESHDTSVVSVYDRYGNPAITSNVVPEFSLLPNNIVITEQWVAQDSTELTINPGIQFNEDAAVWEKLGDDEYITFTVKKKDSLLYKQNIPIIYNEYLDSIIYELPENINAIAYKDESVHLEYQTTNYDLANLIASTESQVSYKEFINDTISCDNPDSLDVTKIEQIVIEQDTICIYRDTIQYTDSVYAGLNSIIFEDFQIFGHMYRNWGQFAYEGNGERADQRIWEGDLNITEARESAEKMEDNDMNFDDVENDEDLGNSFEEQEAYNPEGDKFIMLAPYGDNNAFLGQDNLTYITSNIISSSRKGQDRLVLFDPLASLGGGATAIDKISKNQSVSFNAKVSSVGGSYARTWDKLLTDYMDMNGDRYPDIVTDEKVQYTNHLGALSTGDKYVLNYSTEANNYSTSNSYGLSVGGTPLGSKKETANNVKTSKYALTGNASLSGNYADNETHYTWRDINGDGLPDRINKDDGTVRLNLGYELAPAEDWGSFDINKGQSISINAGGGIGKEINIDNGSIKAGIGLGGSRNILKSGLQDVNGDGLLDVVEVDNNIIASMIDDGTGLPVADKPVQVRFNTGNGFSSPVKWKGANFTSKSKSVNESVNVAFTVGFTIFSVVKVTVTPSINFSSSYSKENLSLNDVDGDGFTDYIESDIDNTLRVKKSKLGKVNKLKKVKRPLYGEFGLNYKPVGNTYEMPQSVWTLSEVEIYDGYTGDGENTMLTTFEYNNGYNDRHERAFYGFGEVSTSQLDEDGDIYRTTVKTFANNSYYEKGLLLSEYIQDADSNKYVETINSYELETFTNAQGDEMNNVFFPTLVETNKYFYDIVSETQLSTKTSFVYGNYGNVETYTEYGGEGDEDNITAQITYHEVKDKNILSVPESITVSGSEGGLRFRSTSIDENTGKITQIRQKIDNSTWAEYDMFYDDYGNLDSIIRPENYKGERMYFTYTYDDVVHNYITNVYDAYGYSSSTTYDYRFGQVLSTTDINGQQTVYEIDDLGRITKITGPYELESGQSYTIRFAYHPDDDTPWARTQHYDPEHQGDPIETAIFIDGLGRVLQTKKDAALFKEKNAEDEQVMIASGKVIYDAYGRAEKSYYPVIDRGAIGNIVPDADESAGPSIAEYDVLDRTTLTILPDDAETITSYTIDNDPDGNTAFITSVTDAKGITTHSYTDVKGRQTAVKAPAVNGVPDGVITSFVYNAINELISVTDAEGNTTTSEYDMLGRRLLRNHPDAGITEYIYDASGNMLTQVTPNLREENMEITYEYEHNRLTNIIYPENEFNNVRFEYGEPGAEHNRAGRIVVQEDGTGVQEFFYGELGEIVKNIRTIIVPDEDIYTFETKWEYDTWNRLKKMIYPDGEEVIYNYNTGGLLQSMYGKKKGHRYNYINQLGYDKFEDRAYIAYGNGTETTYEYEPDRRRLHHIATTTSAGRKIMDNTYTYDEVNNITKLKGIAPIPAEGFLGGNFEYNYNYDNLYRLESANGQWNGYDKKHRYNLEMQYSPTGSIKRKNQLHEDYNSLSYAWDEKHKTSYDWDYKYEGSKPHAPSQIGENEYAYDANGNQTGWQSTVNNQRRDILWDEENRIRAIADNGQTHHYLYDASGERVIKATGDGQAVYVNGFPMGGSGTVGSYTMYVNPYLVATNERFTKHYYIEGQRIVSKIGEPAQFQHIFPTDTVIPAGGDSIDWDLKGQALKEAIYANFETLGLGGAVFTAGKSGKVPYGQIKKYYRNSNQIDDSSSTTQTNTTVSNKYEKFQYFYHPDHLGSSSFITDASGEAQQHMEYFPFGETFIEEHHGHDRYSNYKFNGKELDEETGLYYYGARYYDPRTSIWQSVDPMMDSYLSTSDYMYVRGNPMLRIDPNGMFDIETGTIEKGDNLTKITKEINSKYGTKLTINEIAKANEIKDPNKINVGDKIELPGQNIELEFNLKELKVTDKTYNIDMPGLSWEGTSGREGFQDSKFQNEKDKGPIPEGYYLVDPDRTQAYSSTSNWDRLKGKLGGGTWPGGTNSWGEYRTWLTPQKGTNTFSRGGFSIHGGSVPGSAGCIDLTKNNNSFHKWLGSYGKLINLKAKY